MSLLLALILALYAGGIEWLSLVLGARVCLIPDEQLSLRELSKVLRPMIGHPGTKGLSLE